MGRKEDERVATAGVAGYVKKSIDTGLSITKKSASKMVERTRESASSVVSRTSSLIYNTAATLLTFVLIIAIAVFMYGTFYYAYMPLEMHAIPINLQFNACEEKMGLCSFPNATVHLDRNQKLMIGQPYTVSLLMELPDSVNNQALGMFMSCLTISSEGKPVKRICKSAMLEFRSELLRILETFVFSPFLLTGMVNQRQWLNVNYLSRYVDDPHLPASEISIEVQSKFVQVYNTQVLVHAEFSGLRHIMYHHPWLSTTAGILSNILILTIIMLISWTRFFTADELDHLEDYDSGLYGDITERDRDEELEILKVSSQVESIK